MIPDDVAALRDALIVAGGVIAEDALRLAYAAVDALYDDGWALRRL